MTRPTTDSQHKQHACVMALHPAGQADRIDRHRLSLLLDGLATPHYEDIPGLLAEIQFLRGAPGTDGRDALDQRAMHWQERWIAAHRQIELLLAKCERAHAALVATGCSDRELMDALQNDRKD